MLLNTKRTLGERGLRSQLLDLGVLTYGTGPGKAQLIEKGAPALSPRLLSQNTGRGTTAATRGFSLWACVLFWGLYSCLLSTLRL